MAVVQEELSSDTVGHTTFLNEKSLFELRKIVSDLKIDPKFPIKSMKKIELIASIMENTMDYKDDIQGDEKIRFDIYEVRYVGPSGQNVQNPNSTPSRTEYIFRKDTWTEVEKIDFEKYHRKLQKSIEADSVSHWQVRKRNRLGDVKNFFVTAINSILSRKAKELKDLPHINSERLNILKQMNIRSFQQLLSIPRHHIAERLKISNTEVLYMMEEARRAIS